MPCGMGVQSCAMRKTAALLIFFGALLGALAPAQRIPEEDARNTVLDSRTHYQMPVFASREAWQERASFLRKQILSSAGLLPLPEKTPLNPQISGRLEREGYTIEKVLIETLPGFYLGGNLYRPLGRQGPFPGVVSPHGHWQYGRLEHSPAVSVPGRCINLARQGFVVFSYDMIGYNDTDQLPHHWGEPQHDLWSLGPMGVQLWNSIRAVDFVTSLPDVDANRIGCTGASGGGTQTFFLTAVDDRIKVAAPVNMISATAQGGVCENASNLRAGWTDFSNMVVGALAAPRPLLLVSAGGDWTRNTPVEEFPAIRSIYRLLGVEKNVENVQVNALHNFNQESREAVYKFFNERLLDKPGPVPEQSFRVEHPGDMLALFGRTRPANSVNFDQFVANWMRDAERGTERLRPRDAASLAAAREAFTERLTFSLLVSAPKASEILSEKREASGPGESLLIGRRGKGDRVPVVLLAPAKPNPDIPPTLVVHPDGAAWAANSSQSADGLVKLLMNQGGTVMGIDAFQTGSARAPRDTSRRAFANFNQTNDANRVQDILTAIEYLRIRTKAPAINVVGLGMGGVWSYFARALAGDGVNLAADMAQFAAGTDEEYLSKLFIPGLRKAGDFRAAAVLNARGKSLVYNASPQFPADWARQASEAAGANFSLREGQVAGPELAAWLVPQQQSGARRRK
jgi:dienelactone hydrolase